LRHLLLRSFDFSLLAVLVVRFADGFCVLISLRHAAFAKEKPSQKRRTV
jgi:hypothetical protein